MRFRWRNEWPLWLILAAMFVAAAVTWPHAPDRVPVHWGTDGQVNGYGGKFEGLLLTPLIAVLLYLLFLVLPKLDPLHANYESFAGAYALFRFTILLFLALVYAILLLWIRGHRVPINVYLPIFLGGLFLVLGIVLGKVRPNWFVGIRTPWTLSSKRSWIQTHRAARWVFTVAGAGMIVAGLRESPKFMIGVAILMAVGIVGAVVYSYLLWRDDPDRVTPAGTFHGD